MTKCLPCSYSYIDEGVNLPEKKPSMTAGRVAELFAGVGGFRLGLEAAGWETVYSNQWEPSTKRQHASEVYVQNFGKKGHSNQDIATVEAIPEQFDMLVGGFPCQDYSVARTKASAAGLEGKKGVLWWEILRLTKLHKPKFLFLENVDRLLKSPSNQRGRDFAIMLSSLGAEGYTVEWRVANAADYGFPQRRRRVFIVAYKAKQNDLIDVLEHTGVLANALPIHASQIAVSTGSIERDLLEVSQHFGEGLKLSPFRGAGVFENGTFVTRDVIAQYDGPMQTLGDVLLATTEDLSALTIDSTDLPKWQYLKGAKSEERTHASGYKWKYTEGSMSFPDSIDKPSRTLLTGEGGTSPSRFKHVVSVNGVHRRLHPIELERLNGFPDDWTRQGDGEIGHVKRAFFMGNALVVGLVERVGKELAARLNEESH